MADCHSPAYPLHSTLRLVHGRFKVDCSNIAYIYIECMECDKFPAWVCYGMLGYGGGTKVRSLSLSSPSPVCRVRGELKVQTANWMCPKGSGPPPPPPPSSRKKEGRGKRREGKAVEKTTDLSAAFYLGKDER